MTRTNDLLILAEVETNGKLGDAELLGGGGFSGRLLEQVSVNFDELTAKLKQLVEVAARHLQPGEKGPERIEMELGLKVDAKGDFVLAKVGSGLHLSLKVVWKQKPPSVVTR